MSENADSAMSGVTASSGFRLPWAALSIALAVLALASMGTLAVVVSVKNADTLSTVALALAVLAFAAQLIVTLAQAQQASQVNADMKSALADMRASTASLLANQTQQFDTVLQAALRQAVPAAIEDVQKDSTSEDGGVGAPQPGAGDLEERLLARLEQVLHPVLEPKSIRIAGSGGSLNKPGDAKLRRLLDMPLPKAEADTIRDVLDEVDGPAARRSMRSIAVSLRRQAPPDRIVTLSRTPEGPSDAILAMQRLGIIEEVSAPPSGSGGVVRHFVTPLGLKVARYVLSGEAE